MAIMLTGSRAVADKLQAAAGNTLQLAADFKADTVPAGTEALVFTVGADMEALPEYSVLRGEFEALKGKGVSIILVFAGFPKKEEMWLMYWAMVLPFVDLVVLPYADALKMFENDAFANQGGAADAEYCATVSLSMINLGCAAVLFTLDKDGLYLRTSSVHPRLSSMGKLAATTEESWWAREIYRPGAGCPVCAAAGLLAGLQAKAAPEKLMLGIKADDAPAAKAFAAFTAENGVFTGKFNKVEA